MSTGLTSPSSLRFLAEVSATDEYAECLRELCRTIAEVCGQNPLVPPLVELCYALTCAKCIAGGVSFESLRVSQQDCVRPPKKVQGLHCFIEHGSPMTWKRQSREAQNSLNVLTFLLWTDQFDHDGELVLQRAMAVISDFQMMVDLAFSGSQLPAVQSQAGEKLIEEIVFPFFLTRTCADSSDPRRINLSGNFV